MPLTPSKTETLAGNFVPLKRSTYENEDGSKFFREYTDPGDVVAVLAFNGIDFYLTRQPREVVGEDVLSICAGKIDSGETPEQAAQRELKEETGIEASYFDLLGIHYSSEGITTERCYVYLAWGNIPYWKSFKGTDLEEQIEVVKVPLANIDEAIEKVTTSKAQIALLHLWRRQAQHDLQHVVYDLEGQAETAGFWAGNNRDRIEDVIR